MFDYRQTDSGGYETGDRFHLRKSREETIRFMRIQKKSYLMKAVAMILVLALLAPVSANAAMPKTVMPLASYYLAGYTAYICAMGGGDLEIWFEVTGTGTQEYLGVVAIYLYESTDNVNWSWVKTYLNNEYDSMLATNDYHHMDHVDYDEAAPGRYYKAYVGIWGGPDPGGDSRYIWTDVERAT